MTDYTNWDNLQASEDQYTQQKLHYDFQQAQMILTEEPMEYECPAGTLLPAKMMELKITTPLVSNNNVNNNGYAIPQPANEWRSLEPVVAKQEPVVDQKAVINQQLDDLISKEQNKKYSADCLAKKKNLLVEKTKEAEVLREEAELLDTENYLKEANLRFAVNQVLIPYLGDNNSNFDFAGFETIEIQKEEVIGMIKQEKLRDLEFQKKREDLREANQKLGKAEFDQAHKDTIDVWIEDKKGVRKASDKTLATRVHRAKEYKWTCQADLSAAMSRYTLKHHRTISSILDSYWNHFSHYLRNILQDPAIWEQHNANGSSEQLFQIYSLLFNPG
uniref:CDC37_N domain-containing protein n=1 Tax=Caenorhabditis tropicalis TaxID=1561998 RepID=A0A1I7U8S7_9PELO